MSKNYRNFINLAKQTFDKFETRETSLTLKIYFDGQCVLSSTDREMSKYFFGLFNRLKSELKKNKNEIESRADFYTVTPERIDYYFSTESQRQTDIVILDLRSAYITIAHKIGFISNDLYEKINNLSKPERLVILGMIASNPYYYKYEVVNGAWEYTQKRIKEDKFLYQVFIYIQYELGKIMDEIRCEFPRDVLYFWVDEIGFNPDRQKEVEEFVSGRFGYTIKLAKCEIRTKQQFTYVIINGKNKLTIPKDFTFTEITRQRIYERYKDINK